MGEYLSAGTHFYNFSEIHNDDAIGDVFYDRQIMRNKKIRQIMDLLETFD